MSFPFSQSLKCILHCSQDSYYFHASKCQMILFQLRESMSMAFQNNKRKHKTLLTVKHWSFVTEVLFDLCN